MSKQFWKTFGVVFAVAFAANVLTAYFWDRVFPNSSWHWDTTTASAGMAAVIVAFILRRRKGINGDTEAGVAQDKIMGLFMNADEITNDDVEKALGVSDATATRYLDWLEKEGKIIQIGRTGKYTHYKKSNSSPSKPLDLTNKVKL